MTPLWAWQDAKRHKYGPMCILSVMLIHAECMVTFEIFLGHSGVFVSFSPSALQYGTFSATNVVLVRGIGIIHGTQSLSKNAHLGN